MNFLTKSYLNTTTMIAVNSNTLLASSIFNRNNTYQYFSEGFANDATTSTITINFGSTVAISAIGLLDVNWKSFDVYYDGVTANALTLVNSDTTASNYSNNSATAKFLRFDTIACTSFTFDVKSTIVADQEKAIGLAYFGSSYFDFERVPSSNNYKPTYSPTQIVHTLADGGVKVHNIAKKFEIDISFKYLNDFQRSQLKSIYDLEDVFWFAAFPTATGWDEVFFESNWIGDFDFYQYSDNAQSSGYSGKIKLRETPA